MPDEDNSNNGLFPEVSGDVPVSGEITAVDQDGNKYTLRLEGTANVTPQADGTTYSLHIDGTTTITRQPE
jgi:hypothetical protein